MARLELRRVSKVYPGGVTALQDVDLDVDDGEILVLVGPNGSGKTTLLRLIAGLERLSSGAIRIGGLVVDHWSPWRRDVAMMFQAGVLYPHLTAGQNMMFGSQPGGGGWWDRIRCRVANLVGTAESAAKARTKRERIRQTAQLLGVEQLLDRYPRQLSGGESQRIALGRALVRQPAVFLLDEPWSNVDVRLRPRLRWEFQRCRREVGGAMILVTHDHSEALSLGDRVAVIEQGLIQQIGRPEELIAAPRTKFVAEFVNGPEMNFLAGELIARREQWGFESGDLRIELPRHATGEIAAGADQANRAVWLAVRADALVVHRRRVRGTTADDLQGSNQVAGGNWLSCVAGEVVGSEVWCGMRHVVVRRTGSASTSLAKGLLVAKADGDDNFNLGDEVWLSVDGSRTFVFDQQTGSNLSLRLEVKTK